VITWGGGGGLAKRLGVEAPSPSAVITLDWIYKRPISCDDGLVENRNLA